MITLLYGLINKFLWNSDEIEIGTLVLVMLIDIAFIEILLGIVIGLLIK